MILFMSATEAQEIVQKNVRTQRLKSRLTQRELANRSGVALATIRKFEQTGQISLKSFLKIQMVLGLLDDVVNATKSDAKVFKNMDDVLNDRPIVPSPQGRSKHYGS